MQGMSIVIVNWNGASLLSECIGRLITSKSILEIIIVDNNSTDGSKNLIEILRCESEKIVPVYSSVNLGFARGCNLGTLLSKGEYVLFLNADVIVSSKTLENALGIIERNHYGALGIRLTKNDGEIHRSCSRFPTLLSMIAQSVGLNKLSIFRKTGYVMDEWGHDSSSYVDHVIGAFYLVSRNTLFEIGGMDESYFVYFEDLDLSLRIANSGRKVYYDANLSAYHEGGGSSKSVKAVRLSYALLSRIIYVFKNMGNTKGYLHIIFVFTIEYMLRILQNLAAFDPAGLESTLQAYKIVIQRFPETIRKATASGMG